MGWANMILLSFLVGSLRPAAGLSSLKIGLLRKQSIRLFATPATSFDDGVRPFEITTPIYYVNDKPHIGHAYTSIGKYANTPYFQFSIIQLTCFDTHTQTQLVM